MIRKTSLHACALAVVGLAVCGSGHAASINVAMQAVTANGVEKSIGAVTATEVPAGVQFTPTLKDLPPGPHGFHMHEKPSCDAASDPAKGGATAAAFAAGGHYDPDRTTRHEGPQGAGHKGDLPALNVDAKGVASEPVIAPHLKLADLAGRSLMIHAGGDNYADQPEKLGGGGARIACGVIP